MDDVSRPKRRSRARKAITLRLPEAVEQRLLQRIAETGLERSEAVGLLLSFALEVDSELADVEQELGWYAANRRLPISRAIAQLTARSLGIEPIETDFSEVGGTA